MLYLQDRVTGNRIKDWQERERVGVFQRKLPITAQRRDISLPIGYGPGMILLPIG
jgi:hypothetical protein